MQDQSEFATPECLKPKFQGLSTKTLANLRSQGRGPRYFKQGRRIFYRISDVRDWLTKNPRFTADQSELT
jgi:hypothetical protein